MALTVPLSLALGRYMQLPQRVDAQKIRSASLAFAKLTHLSSPITCQRAP